MPKDLTESQPGGLPKPAPQPSGGDKSGSGTNRGDRQGSWSKPASPLSEVVKRGNRPPALKKR